MTNILAIAFIGLAVLAWVHKSFAKDKSLDLVIWAFLIISNIWLAAGWIR